MLAWLRRLIAHIKLAIAAWGAFRAGKSAGAAEIQAAEVKATEKVDEKVAHAADGIPSAGDVRGLAAWVRAHPDA